MNDTNMAGPKVYCSKCGYFSTGLIAGVGMGYFRCNAPDNVVSVKRSGDWQYPPTIETDRRRDAPEINKNSDCEWYSFKGTPKPGNNPEGG